jgi:transposase
MSKISFKENFHGMEQLFLPRLDDLVPEDSPVRLVSRIVDNLDLSPLLATYHKMGASNYDARVLLKIVFYAYMCNIYSCRQIEKQMRENVLYMWLSGMMSPVPSFNTINRFRSKHLKESINKLFSQVVLMLADMGQISLKEVYVDGTKMESVSNRYRFVWSGTVKHNKEKLQEKIGKILEQIDEGIAQDNREETSLVKPWDSNDLKEKVQAINRENREREDSLKKKKEAGEKVTLSERNALRKSRKQARELGECSDKLAEYEQKERALGGRNSCSTTDPDATFMRMKKEDCLQNGLTLPAYNPQIGTENQYITGYLISQNPGDTTSLPALLDGMESAYGHTPEAVTADGGYGSEQNYTYLEEKGIEAYVKYPGFDKEQQGKTKRDISWVGNLYYNEKEDYYVCPMGQHMTPVRTQERLTDNGFKQHYDFYQARRCTGCPLRCVCHKSKGNRVISVNHNLNRLRDKAHELLHSDIGIEKRKRRNHEPEAVFGQMKGNKHYRRFRHYGLDKVSMDFAIFAVAFNMGKLYNYLTTLSQSGAETLLRAFFSALQVLANLSLRLNISIRNISFHEKYQMVA